MQQKKREKERRREENNLLEIGEGMLAPVSVWFASCLKPFGRESVF